jgi:phosphatidate cytidylyltransferase
MAGPEDPRRGRSDEEDLFEDLDDYFAPLGDTGWAEDSGASEESERPPAEVSPPPPAGTPPPPAGEGTPADDWEVDIDVPDEADLLAPSAEEPSAPTAEASEEPPAEVTAEPEEEELAWDEMRAEAPPEDQRTAKGEPPEGVAGGPDEDLIGEPAVSAEDLFEEPAPSEPVNGVGAVEEPAAEDRPEPEVVEAAAEHFATGLRGTPDEVERELLSDLEAPEDETVTIEAGTPAPPTPAAPPPPTWQEGAEPIEEVAEERPAAAVPTGRNLVAASLSGIVLAVAVIVLLVIDKGPFAVFASIVILLGQAELYAVMRSRRLQPATLLGLVCGALTLAGAYLHGAAALPFGLVLVTGLSVMWFMAAPPASRRNVTRNVAATVLGTVYVPFLAGFALLLLAFPGDLGRNVFLVVLGLTVLYDVIAYAVGTLWGNRPLAPTISPNKSWEGVIGATLGVLIVALAIVPAVEPFTSSRAVGLALVIALVAPLGDLVESALKRDLGVKDMGTLLPGHGGILDRIDAILFAAPAAYYFLQLSF